MNLTQTLDQYQPLSDDTARTLWRQAQINPQVREQLIYHYLRLVKQQTYRFRTHFYRLPEEDIFQAGVEGLLRAVDHFDPDRHVSFFTYARICIYVAMKKAVAQNPLIHIPAQVYRQHYEDFQHWYVTGLPEILGTMPSQQKILAMDCERWLHVLTKQQEEMMVRHYGLRNQPQQTIDQVAQAMKLSPQRILHLKREAMSRIYAARVSRPRI